MTRFIVIVTLIDIAAFAAVVGGVVLAAKILSCPG